MQTTDIPQKMTIPFAGGSGAFTVIPTNSQIGITPGAASLYDGFPPLTRTALASGGVPPKGLDMNGILNRISAASRWAQAGGVFAYDSAFSTAVGGYPNGAILQSSDGVSWWRSTVDNNTTNPDTGGANWVPHFAYGQATQALTNANVTLTAAQYRMPIIVLTGTLTANVNLVFPVFMQQWLVVNNTTGAFSITAKTAGGTGPALQSGANWLYGDGTNIVQATPSLGANSLTANGYQKLPGGLILQWGGIAAGDVPAGFQTYAVTFPIAFPNACLKVIADFKNTASNSNLIVGYASETTSGCTLIVEETSNVVQNATLVFFAIGN